MAIEEYRRFITTVDWGQVSGAYTDLPVGQRLVELTEADQEDTEEIVSALVGYACHQGLLESSAPAIAGALVRLADTPRGAWALRGLQELAAGATGLESTLGFLPPRPPFAGLRPATGPDAPVLALAYEDRSLAVRDAIDEGAAWLSLAIDSDDPCAVTLAIRLLAWASAGGLAKLRQVASDGVRPMSLRAQAWMALAVRGADVNEAALDDLLRSDDPATAAAAVAARLASGSSRSTDDATLDALLQVPTLEDEDDLPWCGGSPAGLVADALSRHEPDDERVVEVFLRALHEWRAHPEDLFDVPEGRAADQIGERLFVRTFGRHLGRRDHLTADELGALERRVLAGIAGVNEAAVLFIPAACGIRDLWSDRERLLGIERGGLDAHVCGRFVGSREVTWPIWKWWHEARNYAQHAYPGRAEAETMLPRVSALLRRVLTESQRRAAVDDARTGAYAIDCSELATALSVAGGG